MSVFPSALRQDEDDDGLHQQIIASPRQYGSSRVAQKAAIGVGDGDGNFVRSGDLSTHCSEGPLRALIDRCRKCENLIAAAG